MNYLYETHCHGSQCSRCAISTTQEMVRAYQAAGFAGLVLTDHFVHGNTAVNRRLPWEERMHKYYDAFLEAKAVGDELDFDVIFGFEHYYGGGKEALVYGVDLDFLLANPYIPELAIDAFADRIHEAGGILIHAHPFRERYYIDQDFPARMDVMDGVEVYNACNSARENLSALELAKSGSFIMTSGGDVHWTEEKMMGSAGVLLHHRVKTTQEFAALLKEKRHGFRVNFQTVMELNPFHLK